MLWNGRREKQLVERFVAALNAHDRAALAALMAEDFTYIDSWREGLTGRDAVVATLGTLFDADPGFALDVDRADWRAPHVLMAGRVRSDSLAQPRRAVWQVLVRGGAVAQYQSWAEGGPLPMARLLTPHSAMAMGAHAGPEPCF